MDQVLGRTPEAELRCEERGQAGAAHVAQQVDGVVHPGVDRGRMSEQAEAASAQEPEAMVDEDVETGLDAGHRARV